MNIPTNSDLFASDQVSPDTTRNYRYQLRNFAQWMHESQGKVDMGKGVVMNTLDVYGR